MIICLVAEGKKDHKLILIVFLIKIIHHNHFPPSYINEQYKLEQVDVNVSTTNSKMSSVKNLFSLSEDINPELRIKWPLTVNARELPEELGKFDKIWDKLIGALKEAGIRDYLMTYTIGKVNATYWDDKNIGVICCKYLSTNIY